MTDSAYADLVGLLLSHTLRFGTELQLQNDVEEILTAAGIAFIREHRLAGDRIDFLAGRVGIECKVGGGPSAVPEQLLRYALRPELDALILVTSKHTHRFRFQELNGKPFRVVWVAGRL